MPYPTSGTTCPTCTDPGTLTCPRCESTSYCSIECQTADWPVHKILCASFANFKERPAPNMRRALYFPVDEGEPRFIWVPLRGEPDDYTSDHDDESDGHVFEEVIATSVHEDLSQPMYWDTDRMVDTELKYDLMMWYNEDFVWSNSPVNESVIKATQGRHSQHWRGPYLFLCQDGDGGDISYLGDMDMRAYSHAVHVLIDHNNHSKAHQKRVTGPRKISAVRLNCHTKVREGCAEFEAVKICRSHPLYETDALISQVSLAIGMPLYVMKYPGKNCNRDQSNLKATEMNYIVTLDDDDDRCWIDGRSMWGDAPVSWQFDVGNVLLARHDRKPLSCKTAQLFAMYCQEYVRPILDLCTTKQNAHHERTGSSGCEESEDCKYEAQFKITPASWTAFKSQHDQAGDQTGKSQTKTPVSSTPRSTSQTHDQSWQDFPCDKSSLSEELACMSLTQYQNERGNSPVRATEETWEDCPTAENVDVAGTQGRADSRHKRSFSDLETGR